MNEAGENTTTLLRCFFREVQKGSSLPSYLIETNHAKKKGENPSPTALFSFSC